MYVCIYIYIYMCVCVCVCVKTIHTPKLHQNTCRGQLFSVIMLYFTELPVPVAAVSVFYTLDDGRMTPETCRESLQ